MEVTKGRMKRERIAEKMREALLGYHGECYTCEEANIRASRFDAASIKRGDLFINLNTREVIGIEGVRGGGFMAVIRGVGTIPVSIDAGDRLVFLSHVGTM